MYRGLSVHKREHGRNRLMRDNSNKQKVIGNKQGKASSFLEMSIMTSDMAVMTSLDVIVCVLCQLDSFVLTLESLCIPVVLGGVFILRTLPNS